MEQTKDMLPKRPDEEDGRLRRGLPFPTGPGVIVSAARCQGRVPKAGGISGAGGGHRQPASPRRSRGGDQGTAYFAEFQPGEQLQH